MSAPPTTPLAWQDPPESNSLVQFIRKHVQPPSAVYVTRDDVLELLVFVPITTTTVNLSLRFQAPDGQVLPRFESVSAVANGATARSFVFQNAEGFLLSASATAPGAVYGQAFIVLRVRRGGGSADITQGDVLLQGYVEGTGALGFPGSPLISPITRRGRTRSIAVANPAAGFDFSVVVPAGVEWIVRSVIATFTTAVAVANRIPELQIRDAAALVVLQEGAGATQPAASQFTYCWSENSIVEGAFINPGTLPSNLRIPAGWTVGPLTLAIQAADQWSAIGVAVEEFVGG